MKNNTTIKILKDISKQHNTPTEQRVFDKAIAALEYCKEQGLTYYTEEKYFGKNEEINSTNYNMIKSINIEDLAKLLVIKIWEDLGEYCLAGSSQEVYLSHDGEKYNKFEDAVQAEINWLNSIKR